MGAGQGAAAALFTQTGSPLRTAPFRTIKATACFQTPPLPESSVARFLAMVALASMLVEYSRTRIINSTITGNSGTERRINNIPRRFGGGVYVSFQAGVLILNSCSMVNSCRSVNSADMSELVCISAYRSLEFLVIDLHGPVVRPPSAYLRWRARRRPV
jgi:hypothetical protein